MEEIKKTNDDDMEKVAGGGIGDEVCRRCGNFDTWDTGLFGTKIKVCKNQLYGKPYCKKCFELLDNLEKQGTYIGNDEYISKIASLEKEIEDLRKKTH